MNADRNRSEPTYSPGFLERECPGLVRQIEEAGGLLAGMRNAEAPAAPYGTGPCVGCHRPVALPTADQYAWALCTDCTGGLSSRARDIVLAVGRAAWAAGCASADVSIRVRDRHIIEVLRSRAGWRATAHVVGAAGIIVALAILTLWRLS